MPADYYLVLGVSRGADLHKIKSAYRRIAKQHHPDITRSHESAQQFREVKEAYETLADETRRQAYDKELAQRQSPLRPSNVAETIRGRLSIFDEMDGFSSDVDEFFEGFLPGFLRTQKRPLSPKDLYYEIILSPREALEGGLFPVTVPVVEACSRCRKTGYWGDFFCPSCLGYGRVRSERTFSLSIPPRTRHGTQARLSLEDIGLKDTFLNILFTVEPALDRENM